MDGTCTNDENVLPMMRTLPWRQSIQMPPWAPFPVLAQASATAWRYRSASHDDLMRSLHTFAVFGALGGLPPSRWFLRPLFDARQSPYGSACNPGRLPWRLAATDAGALTAFVAPSMSHSQQLVTLALALQYGAVVVERVLNTLNSTDEMDWVRSACASYTSLHRFKKSRKLADTADGGGGGGGGGDDDYSDDEPPPTARVPGLDSVLRSVMRRYGTPNTVVDIDPDDGWSTQHALATL